MNGLVLILFLAVSYTSGARIDGATEEPSGYNYHEKYGIPAAARLQALEQALDFDGSRITGGNLATAADIPHMGGLAIVLRNGMTTICGSSLISNTNLVTAAHCWWDGVILGHSMTVVLGSFMIYVGGTRIGTNEVTTHPDWNPATSILHDVAIITIRRVEFNNIIKPIALPPQSLVNNNFVGTTGRAAGYGMLGDNLNIGTNSFLFYVDLPVITKNECSQYYTNLEDSLMCTSGAGARSICRGDLGGPLAISHNGQDTLIGVAAFVSRYGCTLGRPAVFTRAGPYLNWIQSQL